MKTALLLMCTTIGLSLATVTQAADTAPAKVEKKPAKSAKVAPEVTVAILNFDAGKGQADLAKQLPDLLTAMLSDEPGLKLVERAEVGKTLQEQAASLTGLVDQDKAIKVGKLLGAQILIVGKVVPLDRDTYLTVKLIGAETSAVKSVMAKGKADADIGELLAAVSAKISSTLKEHGQDLLPADSTIDPLPELKKRLASKRLPVLTVSVSEKHQAAAHAAVDPAVETELTRILVAAGFTVLDGSNRDRKPEMAITGEAFSEFGALIGSLTACSARAELKVTEVRAGKIEFTDRVTVRAADLSEAVAGKAALQRAGCKLGIALLEHFAEVLPDGQPVK